MFWLVAICIITFLVFIYEKRCYKNLPPGPLANFLPFVGYLPFLDAEKPEQSLSDLAKKYGKIFSLQMGSILTVVLADAALIREAFKQEELSGRAPLAVTHGIFFGHGLICTEGAFWKDQRGLTQKWLKELGMMKYGSKREIMQTRIMKGINLCIGELKKFSSQEMNPVHVLTNTVGNVVNDFVFGKTYDWEDETWQHIQHLQEKGVKLVGVSAGANFLPVLRFLPSNRKNMNFLLTGIAETHKVYDGIVDECESTLDTPQQQQEQRDSILRRFLLEKRDREKRNDSLAKNCSRKQLNYLLADLFGASLDTTLSTLRWYLLMIAKHPIVQEKIYQEMKSHGLREEFLLDDIEHLNYLKASIAESQRIKTVVPCGIPHGNPTKSTTIGGFFIPKNTMVLPLLNAIHMDEKLWPKPHKYNPDRFIDSNGNFFSPAHFIPFQTGKRMCLGEELAKMFLTLFSANILLKFEIRLGRNVDNLDLSGISGLTMSPPDHRLIFVMR